MALLQIMRNQIIRPLYRNLQVKNTIKIKNLLRKILSTLLTPFNSGTNKSLKLQSLVKEKVEIL